MSFIYRLKFNPYFLNLGLENTGTRAGYNNFIANL